jgi:hypothetical protein
MLPRRVLLGTMLVLLLAVPPRAWSAGEAIFDSDQVFTVDIAFPQPAFWDSLTAYYAAGNEQYMAATVTVNGVAFDSVGVRLKGNASYSHPNDKKPFRLSFDEYRGDQRWDGLKGVHLNNCWEDPTFLREKLHLDLLRDAGIPAPRANFAALSLNGEPWGFYSLVEHVDKTFLTARFGDNGGNLYKAVDGLLGGPISDFRWYGSDPALYVNRYELKTDDSPDPWTDLITVLDNLNNAADVATALPPLVNLESVYRAVAADLMMSSLDSYAGSGRNFYIYFNPLTAKMEWVVWDAGMSFGSYWPLTQNFETLSITYASSTTNRPLVAKIFNDPTLRQEYLQAFCHLFSEHFSSERLVPQLEALAALVRPHVQADPRKMYTNAQFETNLTTDITVGGHRKPGLVAFIAAREANVAAQLDALGIACEHVVAAGEVVINEFAADNTQILDPAGEAEDWLELYNNTAQDLALDGLHLSDDPTTPAKWTVPPGTTIPAHGFLIVWADDDAGQDGLHANFKLSAGGESVVLSDAQGVVLESFTFGAQTVNFTMARVPNGTGEFVQGAPTFGAANGLQPGHVVINEFAASNTVILDPAGEAEDWIELHNNLSQPIDIGGMYLSDSVTVPTKWQFPTSTTIAAHGYLIVWADEDEGQSGLHAAFKLSASGESIVLSSTPTVVLDSVTFGQQIADLTMARVPDGTGPFVQGTPTFNAHNGYGNVVAAGDVVINEFMADNDLILDPAGEAEDWVELYNNTAAAIDLGGLYLSDSSAVPTKWQFPAGTVIAASDFLLVWADEDLAQAGLHAAFKLSSGGEEVVLSNADLSVVDAVAFGPQQTNIAMARIPDGTGEFVLTDAPTPGLSNQGPTAIDLGDPTRLLLQPNYPNPLHGSTTIAFSLPQRAEVRLQIYDVKGRLVSTLVEGELAPGPHQFAFDARGLAAGIYLYRLHTDGDVVVGRMLVLK